MTDIGHLDTERSIDSIRVGARHRTDLGDIDALADSIRELGLLQPITISPDGLLICGRRRLEAMRRLGWATTRVWVRSGLSDELHLLLAERDENTQRKDLSPIEASKLYEELCTLLAEDAADRQRATRFGAGRRGAAPGAAPRDQSEHTLQKVRGDTRRAAARFVTGKDSHHNLGLLTTLRHMVDDTSQPESIRQMVQAELDRIELGAPVRPAYEHVRDTIEALKSSPEPPASARPRLKAVPPLARETSPQPGRTPRGGAEMPHAAAGAAHPPKRSTAMFVATFADLDGCDEHYDVDQLATELTETDLNRFLSVRAAIDRIAEALIARRSNHPTTSKSA